MTFVCDVTLVSVSWVKGHVTQMDIDRGRSTYEDKLGNHGADKLAVAGASQHQVPSEVVADAKTTQGIGDQGPEYDGVDIAG